MSCEACADQEERGDGAPDCDNCQMLAAEDRLSSLCREALGLYRRVASQLTYDLRIYPPRVPMTRDKAEAVWTLLVLIHHELNKPKEGGGDVRDHADNP